MSNSANVPMTRSEEAMAVHKTRHGHSVTFARLKDGRVLLGTRGGEFSVSDDAGLTWSETYTGTFTDGQPVSGMLSLVGVDDNTVGMTFIPRRQPGQHSWDARKMFFCKSTDQGLTWSKPVRINPEQPAVAMQDVLLRTSSGRLICPVYFSIGQSIGNPCLFEESPIVGGYVNGNFISTDAHFYDPYFMGSIVYYSDDPGQTWQRNEDENCSYF